MKIFFVAISCCMQWTLPSVAQSKNGLREKELSFAKLSVETNTRNAFLSNLDSNGVIFNQGRIINGIKAWSRAPEAGGKLLWTPAMSFASSDDQLGFTTGPFEMRRHLSDSVAGSGQYTSVWKRNSAGEWKLVADLGTPYQPSAYPAQCLHAINENLKPDQTITDIMSIESAFNNEYAQNGTRAYTGRLANRFILNKSEKPPLQKREAVMAELDSLPGVLFNPAASGLAQSKDLGYVYGQLQYQGKTGNYLRVWAHTKKGWILLVQVMAI